MRRWQFDVLWGIAAVGLIFFPVAGNFGIEIDREALPFYASVLAFVLTQRKEWTKDPKDKKQDSSQEEPPDGDDQT